MTAPSGTTGASSDLLVQSLQQQLDEKNDQIFDLSLSVSAIETETNHRIASLEQETAQQVRLLQEQLRRTQQEANIARSQAQSLQNKLQQQQFHQRGTAQETTERPSLPAHHQQGPTENSQPDGIDRILMTPISNALSHSSFPHTLAQTLLPNSTLVPWLISLPPDTTASQVYSFLIERVLLHPQDLDILRALFQTLLHLKHTPLSSCTSRIQATDALQNELFQQAQFALLQATPIHNNYTNQQQLALFIKILLQVSVNSPGSSPSLLALEILALLEDDLETCFADWQADLEVLVETFAHAATQWLQEHQSHHHKNSSSWLRQRYSAVISMDTPNVSMTSSPDNGKDDTNNNDQQHTSLKKDVQIEQPMSFMIHSLPIFIIATRLHRAKPAEHSRREKDDPESNWMRTILASVLDVLEAIVVRFWRHPSDEDLTKLSIEANEVIAISHSCVRWFLELASFVPGIQVLRLQMATTASSAQTWNRGASAIALAESLFHNIVRQQHERDHLMDYQLEWNPVRDDLVVFFHVILRSVEVETIRLQKQKRGGSVSFSSMLSECLDQFIGAASLLIHVSETSAVRVDQEIIYMLRLQLGELEADEEEYDA